MRYHFMRAESNRPVVIASAKGDVTGDGIPDNIHITGVKTKDSQYIENIVLAVSNGRSGKTIRVNLKVNSGYNPTVFLGDFTGNKVNDVLIQYDTGGSGAGTIEYIYSFLGDKVKLLFDFEKYNSEFEYKVEFEDYYIVRAKSLKNSLKYLIDISSKDRSYLKEIYDKNGILNETIEGFVNPLSSLFPVDIERDGVYELMAFQKIAGRYNADSLGYFQNILKWDKNEFKLFEQYVAIFGTK